MLPTVLTGIFYQICPDKVTMKLLKQVSKSGSATARPLRLCLQALPVVPRDEQLLDSLFANQSWGNFKETLQIQLQTAAIEDIDIEDSFPTIPAVSCKSSIIANNGSLIVLVQAPPKLTAKERPYNSKMHKWMREHRDFWDIERTL